MTSQEADPAMVRDGDPRDVLVLHSVPDDWLPLTQNWIWEQVRHCGLPYAVMADGLLAGSPAVSPIHVRGRDQPSLLTWLEESLERKLDLSLGFFRARTARRYRGQCTVVFSHFGYQGYRDLFLPKHRHITRFYGWDLHCFPNRFPRWRSRYRTLFERCDRFLVEGPYMQRTLCEGLGCPAEKTRVHHLGTDLAGVPWRQRTENSEGLRVLLAGAFREKKGLVYALEGIGLALREHGMRGRVELVGGTGGHPGAEEYRQRMLDVIGRYRMEREVVHHGFVDKKELQRIAYHCDLAIYSSVTAADGDCEGGYPITILDTMATGLPAIGSRHCDIPEVIGSENGMLVNERDTEAIACALLAFDSDRGRLARSSSAARMTAEAFAWNRLGAELYDFITRLV